MDKGIKTDIELAVEYARAGTNPTFISQVESGWVFLGLNQVLRGCCFLVADPLVATLEDLDEDARNRFTRDMIRTGNAIRSVTGAVRVNYLFLGNKDPVLHVHIVPRFDDEPEEHRDRGPWHYDEYVKFEQERDEPLIAELRQALKAGVDAPVT